MMDLIERDRAIEAVKGLKDGVKDMPTWDSLYHDEQCYYQGQVDAFDGIIQSLKSVPSVGWTPVVEIKRGRWIRKKNIVGQEITVCSVCGEMKRQATGNYCGMCGAKMDEVEE